jgi:hypothetical protein
MAITVRTNNVPRLVIDAYQLTEKERKEFDYINWQAIDSGNDNRQFFRFKGQLYDIGEFMQCPETEWFKGWNGYYSDSAFSGILLKWADDSFDSVIIGQYFS